MHKQDQLLDIPNYEEDLIFYKIMNYPVPNNFQYLLYQKKTNNQTKSENKFSRHKKNELLDEYIDYINQFSRLYKSLPFIRHIYLCNSITFNAINPKSDIDLFIICSNGHIWRARLFSLIIFFIFGLKRTIHTKSKKFCLSFYITQQADNLYNISLPKTDIYLSYWLAHLIPLYQQYKYNIYHSNNRLNSVIPNFPQEHIINIGTTTYTGQSKFKKIFEFLFGGPIGYIIEKFIKIIRLPIILYKTHKHKENGWGIIINDNILKFHLDIRKKVRVKYNLWKKGIHKKIYGDHQQSQNPEIK